MNITSIILLLSLPLGFLNFAIFNVLFSLVIFVLLTIKFSQKARASVLHYLFVIFLYTVFCVLSIFHIFDDNFRYVWLLRYFLILHMLILMSIATVNVSSANRFDLTMSMFISFMYIIFDMFQIFTNSGLYMNSTHRYYGFTAERIVFSNFVAIFIILMMKFGGFSKKFYWQTFFIYTMCLIHIILTGSRSFLVLAILIFIFQNRKLRLKSFFLYFLPLMGIVMMGLFFMFPRFRNLLNFETGSGLSRLNFINQGIEMFRDSPFVGIGFGKSIDRLSQNMPWEESPAMHQDLLQILSEGGITLGLLYLFSILKIGVGKNLMLLLSIVILSTQNLMYYTFFCLIFCAYLRNYGVRQHVIT